LVKLLRRVLGDKFFQSTAVVAFFNLLAGLLNLVVKVYLGRNLSKDSFGLLNSVLSGSLVLSVLVMAMRYRYIEEYCASLQKADYKALFYQIRHFMIEAVLFCLPVTLFLYFYKKVITDIFRINNPLVLVIFLVIVFFLFIKTPVSSFLQGAGEFAKFAATAFLVAVFKTLTVAYCILTGLTFNQVLVIFGVSAFLGFFFSFFFQTVWLRRFFSLMQQVKFFFTMKSVSRAGYFRREQLMSITRYLSGTALFILFFNTDILLVRSLFKNTASSGNYAFASIIGVSMFHLCKIIITVLMPDVVKARLDDKNTFRILKKGLLMVLLVAGSVVLFFNIFLCFPAAVKRITHQYGDAIPLFRWYSFAILPFVLNSILITFYTAMKRFKILYLLLFFPVLQIVLIILLNNGPEQSLYRVVEVNMGIGITMLLLLAGDLYRVSRRTKNTFKKNK